MNKRAIFTLSLAMGLSFAAATVALSGGADRIYGAEPSYVECGDIVFGTGKYEGVASAADLAEGSGFTSTYVSVVSIEALSAYGEGGSAVRIEEGGGLTIKLDDSYRIDKVRAYCYADETAVISFSSNGKEIQETCDWTDAPENIFTDPSEKSVYFEGLGGPDHEYLSEFAIGVSKGTLNLCKLVFTILGGGTADIPAEEPVDPALKSAVDALGGTTSFEGKVEAFQDRKRQ